jgi:hypothetical protein
VADELLQRQREYSDLCGIFGLAKRKAWGVSKIDANDTPAAVTTADSLDDRYGGGRTRRIDKRVGWITAGALVLGGLAVLLFGGWQQGSDLEFKDLSYSIVDAHTVSIEAQVTAPADKTTLCVVEALSESYATVGWKLIELEPGDDRVRRFTSTVVTTAPATTGTLRECWITDPAS